MYIAITFVSPGAKLVAPPGKKYCNRFIPSSTDSLQKER